MTVLELIRELEKIENKELEVYSITEEGKRRRIEVVFQKEKIRDNYGSFNGVVMYGEY